MQFEKKTYERTIIFTFAWVMMLINTCVHYSSINHIAISFISPIAIVLFIFQMFYTRYYSINELTICCIAVFLGICIYLKTSEERVMWYVLVIAASKGVDIKKIIQITFKTMICICICILALFCLGIIDDQTVLGEKGIVRHGFGFGHPNMLQGYMLMLLGMYIYLNYKKINFISIIIMLLMVFGTYNYTRSRTGLISSILILVLLFFLKFFKSNKNVMKVIIFLSVIYIVILTALPILYKSSNIIMATINSALSYRISQANYFFRAYGVGMFGRYLQELSYSSKYIYLDMGYAKMLFNDGILYYLIVVCTSIISMINAYKKEKIEDMFVIITYIFYLGTENVATYIFMNVSMLFITEIIWKKKKGIKNDSKNNSLLLVWRQ